VHFDAQPFSESLRRRGHSLGAARRFRRRLAGGHSLASGDGFGGGDWLRCRRRFRPHRGRCGVARDHNARQPVQHVLASGDAAIKIGGEGRPRFDVTIDLPASSVLHWQATRYTGTAVETIDVVTVDHPIEHGELLKVSDLTTVRRPKTDGTVVTDPRAAAGLAARRQLLPGQPIHDGDLMKPALVQRNDVVTIFYEVPGISLTLRGQAQDSGALGDTINVINTQSKRVMQAVVTGAGRVTVAGMPARVVDNGPVAAAPASPSSEMAEGEQKAE
jgi:flagella basal body P-ring formation protein FlgA